MEPALDRPEANRSEGQTFTVLAQNRVQRDGDRRTRKGADELEERAKDDPVLVRRDSGRGSPER